MKKSRAIFKLMAFIAISLSAGWLNGQSSWRFDFENGAAFNGYNDVGIPKSTGTRFSLTERFDVKPVYFFRLRLTWRIGGRHAVSALFAPLSFKASGRSDMPIRFNGTDFPLGAEVDALYRFNSYRLTYRYDLIDAGPWKVGIGFTAKIRDAAIRLDAGAIESGKTNVGFVPLLHFRVEHQFSSRIGALLEGDALAAKQGRAEDVLLALLYRLSQAVTLKAGYRIVEGGANVEEVYNFALIHYASLGILIDF
jgi:hypothetical protein